MPLRNPPVRFSTTGRHKKKRTRSVLLAPSSCRRERSSASSGRCCRRPAVLLPADNDVRAHPLQLVAQPLVAPPVFVRHAREAAREGLAEVSCGDLQARKQRNRSAGLSKDMNKQRSASPTASFHNRSTPAAAPFRARSSESLRGPHGPHGTWGRALSPGTAAPAASPASPLMNPRLPPCPSEVYACLRAAQDASRTSEDRSAPENPSVQRAGAQGLETSAEKGAEGVA